MTSHLRDIAFCLGVCPNITPDRWNVIDEIEQNRKQFTEFARGLFPEDPGKVDYPFYMLGRWIRGSELSLRLLKDYLQFWEKVQNRIGKTPIFFDILSREESTFEQNVREQLEDLKFIFHYEPYSFNLPKGSGIPRYTPDFILPRCKKKGKTVILEPHGFWTPKEKTMVRYGRTKFTIFANPKKIHLDERRFVNKLRKFKETPWREKYYLILIVPSEHKDRVERDYPKICDEICDGRDIPGLLYNLKRNELTS